MKQILTARPFIFLVALCGVSVILGLMTASARAGVPLAPQVPGIDLTVELALNPASPAVGQNATLNVIYRNLGDVDSGSFTLHGYKDPADQPPIATTAPNLNLGVASLPGLTAGGSGQIAKSVSFSELGCNHAIYVWIDRDNGVGEGDESNNLITLPVCVGVTPTPPPTCSVDAYEDDYLNPPTTAFATWLGEDVPQPHTFCDPNNKAEVDVDLVKFTAFSGVTYTLATTELGAQAQPKITFLQTLNGPALGSGEGSATVKVAYNGILYAKIENKLNPPQADTAYSLVLAAQSGMTDDYEPDNLCATARDITTNGVKQKHIFHTQADQDWVKFATTAGETFVVIADETGSDVSPQLAIFAACNQVASNTTVAAGLTQASGTSNTAQVYYAQVKNQKSGFGSTAKYSLSVIVSNCVADTLEDDDVFAQAKPLAVASALQQHNFCPASDEDWLKFTLEVSKTYVLQTENLGSAADTTLTLLASDGTTQLAVNDDYGYTKGSRLIFAPSTAGVYYGRVKHVNPVVNGTNTQYDLTLQESICTPDTQESNLGNNGPGDAKIIATNGMTQVNNFCADPIQLTFGDQDWHGFTGLSGGKYEIHTVGLGANADTVLELYGPDGATKLLSNDDAGPGLGAVINFTPTQSNTYFVRVTQYNSNLAGNDSNYNLQVFATEPPTPTPTPTFTPTPTPTPSPTPTTPPLTAKTLILTNRKQLVALHGEAATNALFTKLFALAQEPQVNGLVLQVESKAEVQAAYTAWTANPASLNDIDKTNAVIAAVRNMLFAFLDNGPSVKYVVIVGDDRVIPFRRVLDRVKAGTPGSLIENTYAISVTTNSLTAAALKANMILTDDYLVDRTPSTWKDAQKNSYDLFVPDYAVGRLIETPQEISAFIDTFLASPVLTATRAFVSGYDFVEDGANTYAGLLDNDEFTTTRLISSNWLRSDFVTQHVNNPQFIHIQSINGHSTHNTTLLAKNDQGQPQPPVTAQELAAGIMNMAGTVVFDIGCHSGLNDPGAPGLDLPQAYTQKRAHYIGNTGFGYGGQGIFFSEKLANNFIVSLLLNKTSELGPALKAAKQKYFTTTLGFDAHEAKVLMEFTLYGLPMLQLVTSGTFSNTNPFPSASKQFVPPTAFGETSQGTLRYNLSGAFGDTTTADGAIRSLDGQTSFNAGEPIQPIFYANAAAPGAGDLRGVVFTGGTYSTVQNVDPVLALPYNEYITKTAEPSFNADSYAPSALFSFPDPAALATTPTTEQYVVMSLGQFSAQDQSQKLYKTLNFDTFYSLSNDVTPPQLTFVDGLLNTTSSKGQIKVEAADDSGVKRVVIAFNDGQAQWLSQDLTYTATTNKWTGTITGTLTTQYFVQVVDNVGNVRIEDNKGHFYPLVTPLPLAPGRKLNNNALYLPVIAKQ